MSDKFDMKLVIDAVTTPLLHARLSQASSYRERAALLRFLAEAALRGNHVVPEPEQQVILRDIDLVPERASVPPAIRSQPSPIVGVVVEPTAGSGDLRPLIDTGGSPVHDVEQIADAFGSFF